MQFLWLSMNISSLVGPLPNSLIDCTGVRRIAIDNDFKSLQIHVRCIVPPLPISVIYHTNSPQSSQNMTLPFQVDGMWLRWRYLSKKRFACLSTVMGQSVPPKQSPRWQSLTPLYADITLSPALNYHYALAAALCPNLGLFEVALAAEQEEERGVSAQDFIWHSGPWTTCHLPKLTLLFTPGHGK